MIINNHDFEYSYSYEAAKQLTEDSDMVDFICYIDNLRLLAKYYKYDRKSYDLACEIAESIGFPNFLKCKHTYEELVDYYNNTCCFDKDDDMGFLPADTVQEENVKQENVKKPLLDVTFSCDYKIANETKQMKETIETTNAIRAARRCEASSRSQSDRRAELKNRNPNVKCDL